MSIEQFIAKRIEAQKSAGEKSVMSRVATIAVALSVAMMLLSLSIIIGFKGEVNSKLTGFCAEAVLSQIASFNNADSAPITIDSSIDSLVLAQKGALAITPYATAQAIVRNSEIVEGVMLRGVAPSYNLSFLSESLTAGTTPNLELSNREALVSQQLADRLGLEVGSRLEVISGDESSGIRRNLFKICGLYSTGLDEWDRLVIITQMGAIQRLNGWSAEQVSGYELHFTSLKAADEACQAINHELIFGANDNTRSWMAIASDKLYPSIFDWLKAHDVNALIIIIIMIIVAGFNMATALLIMVLERTRMIGVLKAVGMSNKSLQKIFLYRALSIIVGGVAWGNAVAITLCAIQKWFKPISLNAQNYLLQYIPIDLGLWWILLLNALVIASILMLMIIPTKIVGQLKIEKMLKFE